jgi:peptidoglycan/LPS O-acetylase OafA/YrhL
MHRIVAKLWKSERLMTADSANKEARIPSLDGWRALAILLVIISHFPSASAFPRDLSPVSNILMTTLCAHGNLGVRIFFVISGFLITFLLLREAGQNRRLSLGCFYVRRALRIFPVYFLYLGSLFILQTSGLYSDSHSSWIGSLSFLRNIVGRGDSATAHFWSLAVEEQFYIIWPLSILILSLQRNTRLAKALLVVTLMLCPVFRANRVGLELHHSALGFLLANRSLLMYADSLAAGCLGAFFYVEQLSGKLKLPSSNKWLIPALGVVLLTALYPLFANIPPLLVTMIPSVQALAIMVLLWITVECRCGLVYRLLNLKFSVWLGTLSYSLYVWHFLFLGGYAGDKLRQLPIYDWRVWWLSALATAAASYYLWERPILFFRKQFSVPSQFFFCEYNRHLPTLRFRKKPDHGSRV